MVFIFLVHAHPWQLGTKGSEGCWHLCIKTQWKTGSSTPEGPRSPLGPCVLNVTDPNSLSAHINVDRFVHRRLSYPLFCISSKVTSESRWAGVPITNLDSWVSPRPAPFYMSPHRSANEPDRLECSLGALASKAELRWLSRSELWPFTPGVVILVLIQRLLQMRLHGLVLLLSPAGNNTEWLSQLAPHTGRFFWRKPAPGPGWQPYPQSLAENTNEKVVVYLKSVRFCSSQRAHKSGKAEKRSWVGGGVVGSCQLSATIQFPKLLN